MKKSKSVLTIILILVCSLVSSLNVYATGETATYEFGLDLQTYVSTKITFNFPYTNDHTIADIRTVGQSSYKHEGTGTTLTFIGEEVDIYSFTVILGYQNETPGLNVTKNVLVGLWSGNEAMDGYTISSAADIFVIHVQLSLTEQPSYPTPEEVSEAVVHKIEQDLVEQTEMVNSLVARVETLQYTNMILLSIILSVTFCVAIVSVVLWRKRTEAHV